MEENSYKNENRLNSLLLSPERIFLIVAIVVGFLLLLLTPPMAVPDENAHFINAYSVSRGNFFVDIENGQAGVYMPTVYIDFINNYLNRFNGENRLESKHDFSQYYFDSWFMHDLSGREFLPTQLRAINPVGYLVSGFGMAVGNVLCRPYLTPYNLLIFGRAFNLIFYISIMYLALKTTLYFKKTMLILSLMPMSIFLAASLSYDAILIPVSFLLFAYSSKFIGAPSGYLISKKDILVILFVSFFLAGVKLAYFILLLVLFAVPKERFGTKKRYIMCIGMVVAVGLLSYGIPAFFNNQALREVTIDSSTYSAAQVKFLLSHILQAPRILLNSFRQMGPFYANGFFGILGNLDTNFPVPVHKLFYIVLILIVFVEALETRKWLWKTKLFSTIAIFIIIVGIFFATYIGWTSLPWVAGVGADYVSGVQGRYFIPIALFICIIFTNPLYLKFPERVRLIISKSSSVISSLTPVLCGGLTVVTILLRYWC
ncbi:MAG: DUF2142 domain-containing protein [Burkholderiales bacterium]